MKSESALIGTDYAVELNTVSYIGINPALIINSSYLNPVCLSESTYISIRLYLETLACS